MEVRTFRLIAVTAAALTAVAMVPATAHAATAPVYQTAFATCRANLAAPNSVLIIGDSITSGWFAAITAQFEAAGRPVCINAQPGRTIAGGVAQLSRYKTGGLVTPRMTVVMAVGSCGTYGATAGDIRWQVDNVVRIVGTKQRVVWVDVLRWVTNSGPVAQRAYGLGTWVVNLQLWAKDAQYPNVKVAHWNALIRSNYTKYVFDGLHATRYGNTARNDLIMRTIG